jgi:hypothetical protein
VNIYEPRCHHLARGINDLQRLSAAAIPNLHDPAASYRHISPACGRAGAIYDFPASNQQIIHRLAPPMTHWFRSILSGFFSLQSQTLAKPILDVLQ